MRIVTNFARFPARWKAASGLEGNTIPAATVGQFLQHGGRDTVWLVNCDPGLTLRLAAVKAAAPWIGSRLVAADLVLRAPRSAASRMAHPLRRLLLSNVDHFIHYFRDLTGYTREFGVSAGRSSFVPFKVNLYGRVAVEPGPEGEYILCLGRSMRDFDTFFDAMEQLPYPAAITRPAPDLMRRHGARFTRGLDALPSNVRILDDDGSDEAMIRVVKNAKLVVLPILKTSLVASGISTCLNAMSLGKCVIGSEGPGMLDVFENGEVLAAPPEDAAALAAVMRRAWEDEELRKRTAAAGYRYAQQQGGEAELYRRVIDQVACWYKGESGADNAIRSQAK